MTEVIDKPTPKFYDCGCCGQYHSLTFNGDCRQDDARFNTEDLDRKYGVDGWEEVEQPEVTAQRLDDAVCILHEYAANFVTHWMDDDGLDAGERKEVERAQTQMDAARSTVDAALKAAAELKTALIDALRMLPAFPRHDPNRSRFDAICAAIEAAEAAGI